jgi:hypothetical protein
MADVELWPRVGGDLSPEVRTRIDADRHRGGELSVVSQTLVIPWIEDRSLCERFIDFPQSTARRIATMGSAHIKWS